MDELIVLRSSTRRLAKLIQSTPEGLQVQGYDEAATFAWEALPVDGIEALAMELEHLAKDPHACVIRGGIKESSRAKRVVSRRQHVNKEGVEGDWENHKPGRRWVAFDIDKLAVPEGIRPDGRLTRGDAVAIAGYAKRTLPAEFHGAACVYHLSSSAGLHGWHKVSLHLWFWLDRPVYDLSWRVWADGKGVDASLFKSVQAHYTADPVFADMVDPLAGLRFGFLEGAAEVVADASLQGYDAWMRAEGQRVAAKTAEIEARRAAIVGAPEQSASAVRVYALKVLSGAIGDILSAPVGGRHDMMCRKAMHVGGYVQPGCLDEHEAWAALDDAIVTIYEANRHAGARKAAREFLEKGMEKLYDVSERGRKATKKKPDLRVVPPPDDDDVPMPEPGSSVAKKAKPAKKIGGPQWVDLDEKDRPMNTADNLQALIDWLQIRLRWNLMSHEPHWIGSQFERIALECRNAAVASRVMDEAVRLGWKFTQDFFNRSIAWLQADNAFHPVVDWATSKAWDGVSRFDDVMATLHIDPKHARYMPLFRAQLRAWLVSGGKCLQLHPGSTDGVEVQGVLVLQGKQGAGKTRWLKALLPESAWIATGVRLDPSDKDAVRRATSTFIVELGELDATTRKADVAMLKAFLTESKDIYRTPYGRWQETFIRRTIYGASVNPDDFLKDPTGNRRFWPIPVTKTSSMDHIDMQQVWAEAMVYAGRGEQWWLTDDMMQTHEELVSGFAERSPWADEFFAKFAVPSAGDIGTPWKVRDIRHEMMGDYYKWTDADMKRFTQFLKTVVPVYESKGVAVCRVVRVSS